MSSDTRYEFISNSFKGAAGNCDIAAWKDRVIGNKELGEWQSAVLEFTFCPIMILGELKGIFNISIRIFGV
jgi:hypothetical protein